MSPGDPTRDASFLSQHLGSGGAGFSPISLRRLLRQGAGESGVEIGHAVSASVAAPGIAPAPAPAPAGLRFSRRSLYVGARARLFLPGWWEEVAREAGAHG